MHEIERTEDSHAYTLNGVAVPSVTTIIAGLGLIETGWFDQASRDRGHHVHEAIQLWILDLLDWGTVHGPWEGYVRAAVRFLEDSKAENLQTECMVGHQALGYCGTADVFGTLFGAPAVVDWKTGAVGPVTGLQTAAYDLAYPLPSGRRRRLGVELNPAGTYKMRDLTRDFDPQQSDYREWPAAVRLYRRHVWPRMNGRHHGAD